MRKITQPQITKEYSTHGYGFGFRRGLLIAITGAAIALSSAVSYGADEPPSASVTSGPSPVVSHISSAAAIWFHPMPPGGVPISGSVDYMALFQPKTRWPIALAKTQLIGLYAGWVADTSDQDLEEIVTFLNAHNMGIELEAPSLQATATCGTGLEGYVPYGQSLTEFTLGYLQRLQALGRTWRRSKWTSRFSSAALRTIRCPATSRWSRPPCMSRSMRNW